MKTINMGIRLDLPAVVSVKESELEGIAAKSLRNCHAFGLDSVMFDDTPGKRVRAFVARRNHELWMNLGHSLSLAWHPHHCDLTMFPIFGDTFNVTPFRVLRDGEDYAAYTYRSQILNGVGGFVKAKRPMLRCIPVVTHLQSKLYMRSYDIHTVYVPKCEESGWYIFEHREDSLYESVAWSNTNLSSFDFSRLYKPMTVARLRENLMKLKITIEEGQ